jgi:monothiol glutaredoxin
MAFEPGTESERSAKEIQELVDRTIEDNEVVMFIKGTELMPQCGYSRKALGLVQHHRDAYETVDVLESLDQYREALADHSGRETIPQIFVDGEFVGGSDILEQLHEAGDLKETLNG